MKPTFYRPPTEPAIVMGRLFNTLGLSKGTEDHCRMYFETTSDATVISFYHSAPKNAPRDLLKCLKKNGIDGAIAIKEIGERTCTDIHIPMGQDKLEEAIKQIRIEHSKHKSVCAVM